MHVSERVHVRGCHCLHTLRRSTCEETWRKRRSIQATDSGHVEIDQPFRDQWAGFYKPKTLRTLSHAPWHNPTFVTCSMGPTLPFKLIPMKKKIKIKIKKQYSSIFGLFYYSFINTFTPSPFTLPTILVHSLYCISTYIFYLFCNLLI